MANSNQEKQDQRTSSSMEDSAMTIEFLRARLLAERSVSKSARQRAEELGKRVEELEEQLRIVSLQRRMAEKATVDVLSILENRGISEASETFDSSSDEETHRESHEEHSVSKRRNKLEEHSGSDLDSSPVSGRTLSWKGRSKSPRSRERYKDLSTRRRNAFSSIGSSSPRHHLGKSCRQIRRRETRMVVEEHKTEPINFDSRENGFANAPAPEGLPDCSDSRPETVREDSETQKLLLEGPFSGNIENERSANHLDVNGHEQDGDMEKALEDQAQLIGQYEEMEKAQREWEEKFRENNTSTPDSYDPGNHSDVTEERDEVKAQTPYTNGTDILESEEAKTKQVDASNELSKPRQNGFVPPSHVDMVDLKDQMSSSTNSVGSRSQAQEFAFPTAKEKEIQESQGNHDFRSSESLHHDPTFRMPLGNQPSDRTSSEAGSSSHRKDVSESQNDMYALVPHNPPNALGGVLDALKQAKLSLQQKINRVPSEGTTVNKSIEHPPFGTRTGDRTEIPVGCSGLFRLPTDFSVEGASTRGNFLGSGSRLPILPYYPDNGVAATAPDRFSTTSYVENQSRFPTDSRFLTSSSVMSGSRASTLNSRFDSYLDTGLSSVNRYTYTPQPSYPPFPDLMSQIPSDEGLLRPFPSSRPYGTPADRLPFYNDQVRPNMYR